MNPKINKAYPLIHGFTILEILIVLLVLSIGMLGVAFLQSQGQAFTFTAYVQTQSNMLAYEIMDQIRANVNFAKSNVEPIPCGNGINTCQYGYVANVKPTVNQNCDTSLCTPAQLRDYDLGNWYDRLESSIPGGTGVISAQVIGTVPNQVVTYYVEITWRLREEERDSASETKTIRWVMQI